MYKIQVKLLSKFNKSRKDVVILNCHWKDVVILNCHLLQLVIFVTLLAVVAANDYYKAAEPASVPEQYVDL